MLQDLRLAVRRVLYARGFSVCVVLILGTGVGAVSAMGSVMNALAFRVLTLPSPETLVALSTVDHRNLYARNTPLPAIDKLREAGLPADGWCAYNSTLDALESGGLVIESRGELLSGDCVQVIGLTPVIGRWFTADEAPLNGTGKPVMVITHRLWQQMFGGGEVLGRVVKIQNISVTIIGVMPERYLGFSQDLHTDYILPFNAHRASSGAYMLIGRLQPGATVEQLRARVRTLWPSVLEAVLPANPSRPQALTELNGHAESMARGLSTLRRLYETPVRRLLVLALALFVLVCVNVGGLMISRVSGRAHEIAALRALGASTLRIARPLAIECGIFALAGTALGVPIAYAASNAFASLLPTGNVPWDTATTPDQMVLAATVAGSIVVALMIAAVPVWLASRLSPQLRADRSVTRATSPWAQALLIAQVAVTVVLVFTGGLIIRSFNTLRSVDAGFDGEHLLSLRLSANPGGYADFNPAAYYPALVERIAALPGVQSVGMARYFGTISASMAEQPVGFAGRSEPTATGVTDFVSPGFFATLGVPLLKGRDIAWTDLPDTPPVAIVSESLARALAPDGNVVGRVIRHGASLATSRLQIVGVAGNLSMGNFRHTDVRMIYLSSVQAKETAFATIHVRTQGPPMQLAAAGSQAVAAMGREHVRGAYAHNVLFTNSIVAERMGAMVSGAAAVVALLISGIGLFALLSHSVQKRTREIGIRVAVGASPTDVSRLVIRDALVLVFAGIGVGAPLAIGATSLVKSLLYGVTSTDTATLALSAALLVVSALVGAVRPALRAVRVDPSIALRAE